MSFRAVWYFLAAVAISVPVVVQEAMLDCNPHPSHTKVRRPASLLSCERLFEAVGPSITLTLPGLKSSTTPPAPKKLRVGHYNLQDFKIPPEAFDGTSNEFFKIDDPSLKPAWAARSIVRMIESERPDVLFLSEIGSRESLEILSKQLGDVFEVVMFDGNDRRGIDIAVLVRKSLPFEVSVQSHRAIGHNYLGRYVPLFSRDFLLLELRAKGEVQPLIRLGASHFKAMLDSSGDPASVLKRTAQMDGALQIFQSRRFEKTDLKPEVPEILLGDFNSDIRTGPEFAQLRKAGFEDAFEVMKVPFAKRVTHVYFPKDGTASISRQLDGFFVSKLMAEKQAILSAYVVEEQTLLGKRLPPVKTIEERRQRATDHSLVIVEVDLEKIKSTE